MALLDLPLSLLYLVLQSVDEVGLTHFTPHPTRPRVAHNLLSHLPLHSQHPGRSPSHLIPIGGIHMIQPRSTLPVYSLVSSPIAATASPAGTSWRLSDAPKQGRFPLPQRQDTLKETGSRARPQDPGSGRSDALSHRGCFGVQSPETRCVHPETPQGQKKAPSSQL